MNEREKLFDKIDHAAADLILTHFAGLTNEGIKVRMKRIADDLTYEMN